MVIAVADPKEHNFCTFDTDKKIYHTDYATFENRDIWIYGEYAKDVKKLIQNLDEMGFKEVSPEQFLKKAKFAKKRIDPFTADEDGEMIKISFKGKNGAGKIQVDFPKKYNQFTYYTSAFHTDKYKNGETVTVYLDNYAPYVGKYLLLRSKIDVTVSGLK